MALEALKSFRIRELAAISAKARQNVASRSAVAPRLPNPFIPHKNPTTGRWAPPKYSLRRQADLVKSAKTLGLLHLLPPSPNYGIEEQTLAQKTSDTQKAAGSEWWQRNIIWQGELWNEKNTAKEKDQNTAVKKRVPSMTLKRMDGLGAIKLYMSRKRMFKGHKWERVKAQREKRTRMLMRDMEERISRYKEWYHRRRPNPLKPSRSPKAPKLPY